MRHLGIAALLALAACASSPTGSTSCDCCKAPTPGFGFTNFGSATFVDNDDDGLPDARLPEPRESAGLAEVWRANAAVQAATDTKQLDAALADLAAAATAARANLAARK